MRRTTSRNQKKKRHSIVVIVIIIAIINLEQLNRDQVAQNQFVQMGQLQIQTARLMKGCLLIQNSYLLEPKLEKELMGRFTKEGKQYIYLYHYHLHFNSHDNFACL